MPDVKSLFMGILNTFHLLKIILNKKWATFQAGRFNCFYKKAGVIHFNK